jgi:hypothetical protein
MWRTELQEYRVTLSTPIGQAAATDLSKIHEALDDVSGGMVNTSLLALSPLGAVEFVLWLEATIPALAVTLATNIVTRAICLYLPDVTPLFTSATAEMVEPAIAAWPVLEEEPVVVYTEEVSL